eukprot:15144151-Heterocapsa_arctica.AAC.1
MADDIEATEGINPAAPRLPDEMVENLLYRSCIKTRLRYFFGSDFPTSAEMYAKRGMLAQEARQQERKAEGAALLGIPYVPPRTHLAAPART